MKTDGKNLLLNTEMNFPESADKDRHLMRYTLLQEKNHHMAFLSQFWPLSDHSATIAVAPFNFDGTRLGFCERQMFGEQEKRLLLW